MPVRNEADFLAESLGAVLSQDYPSDRMEVFVADGMSTDGTRDRRRRPGLTSSRALGRRRRQPGRIVAKGLNAALGIAKGEIVVRVDGHCRIATDYVSRCVEHLCRDDVDGVGGSINTIATTPVGRAIAAVMSSPFGVGGSAFRTVTDKTMLVDTVPFLLTVMSSVVSVETSPSLSVTRTANASPATWSATPRSLSPSLTVSVSVWLSRLSESV